MDDLRVPTTSLPAEILCADGETVQGEVFLPAQSARQPGPMPPDEWVESVHVFFPVRSTKTRALTIVNRDTVVAITVPAAANCVHDDELVDLLGEPLLIERLGLFEVAGERLRLDRGEPLAGLLPLADGDLEVLRLAVERRQLPGVVRLRRRVLFRSDVLLDWLDQKRAPSPEE